MRKLYERFMGHPLVYDWLRPFILGQIPAGPAYELVMPVGGHCILDVGCGTGVALNYLKNYSEYHGFDTDKNALAALRRKNKNDERVHLYNRYLEAADVQAINPDTVLLMGLLHHLDDDTAKRLLVDLRAGNRLRRILTLDVFFEKGAKYWTSNFLARLDRGRHVRTADKYRNLAAGCGYKIIKEMGLCSGNKLARYHIMCLGND